MKASELRAKNLDDLNQELNALVEEQFKLSLQRATGQLSKPHLISKVRRNIARVKTVIHQQSQVSVGNSNE